MKTNKQKDFTPYALALGYGIPFIIAILLSAL